jgi:hypothetical protein
MITLDGAESTRSFSVCSVFDHGDFRDFFFLLLTVYPFWELNRLICEVQARGAQLSFISTPQCTSSLPQPTKYCMNKRKKKKLSADTLQLMRQAGVQWHELRKIPPRRPAERSIIHFHRQPTMGFTGVLTLLIAYRVC